MPKRIKRTNTSNTDDLIFSFYDYEELYNNLDEN